MKIIDIEEEQVRLLEQNDRVRKEMENMQRQWVALLRESRIPSTSRERKEEIRSIQGGIEHCTRIMLIKQVEAVADLLDTAATVPTPGCACELCRGLLNQEPN